MEQICDLEKSLKLLKGLDNDATKRANIIEYARERGTLSVFAYASLIWNPFEHVEQIISNCILTGYVKGFFCQDFIYRGTTDYMGLTMGLKSSENSFVKGYILKSGVDRLVPFIEAFVKRETPIDVNDTKMDIYTYDFLPVLMPDGNTIEWALTCVVNCESQFYLPMTHSIEQQAEIISRSYGLNGSNFSYLHNTIIIYRQLALLDTFTEKMEELYATVLRYREQLIEQYRQWLDKLDKLSTKDERQLEIKSRNRNNIQIKPQRLFNRMFSIAYTATPKYHRMISV